ncbi:hypothetical protein AWZ03_003256 [Drosophila navojoa]|uniref:Uncharacterized protein n=2 Tax=Drosophila navojoa TaxID=7232 RepID=A0A484BRH1_DRONA|nr:hypothetical protein AWZ03_003256 [Drosophila navojoa]
MYITALSHVILVGACCYALYTLTPAEFPYAYTAAAFCLVHGLLGVVRTLEGGGECDRTYAVSSNIVEVIPLPLANIEFYSHSSESGVALVHALSLILLLYDLIGSMADDWNSSTDTVKDISLLGNIASGTYIGVQEENYFHVGVAAAAAVSRFGPTVLCPILPEIIPYLSSLGKAAIIGVTTYALTN